jgi:hypothetical protein
MARSLTSEARIELAKTCLRLIGQIAERGARSQNPEIVGAAGANRHKGYDLRSHSS